MPTSKAPAITMAESEEQPRIIYFRPEDGVVTASREVSIEGEVLSQELTEPYSDSFPSVYFVAESVTEPLARLIADEWHAELRIVH